MTTPSQILTSNRQDWRTPRQLFDVLDTVFQFRLDPCTSPDNPLGTAEFYTEADDGLSRPWPRNAFINPPYRRQRPFVEKARAESNANGTTNVCLIPARTDTKLWHEVVFPHASAVCFVKGRLSFSNSRNSSTFPSALVVFGHMSERRYGTLERFGRVVLL
jgi:site-specific DNA-methyltransferase (adenine-specific)